MLHSISAALVTALILSSAACGKKDDAAPKGSTASAKVAEGTKAASPGPTKLAKLDDLTIEAGGADIGEGIAAGGVMLTGGAVGALNISVATTPKSEADAKSDADMFSPKNYKVETLPDGYVATYDNTGDMGANFFVDSQRTIGGKVYHCSTTVTTASQQAASVAACKSLKK